MRVGVTLTVTGGAKVKTASHKSALGIPPVAKRLTKRPDRVLSWASARASLRERGRPAYRPADTQRARFDHSKPNAVNKFLLGIGHVFIGQAETYLPRHHSCFEGCFPNGLHGTKGLLISLAAADEEAFSR